VAVLPINCVSQLRDAWAREQVEWQRRIIEGNSSDNDNDNDNDNSNNNHTTGLLWTASYDVIIIALGIWHDIRPYDCRLPEHETIRSIVAETVQIMKQHYTVHTSTTTTSSNNNQNSIRVLWRTGGWKHGLPRENTHGHARTEQCHHGQFGG
jgi:hypothetical protein